MSWLPSSDRFHRPCHLIDAMTSASDNSRPEPARRLRGAVGLLDRPLDRLVGKTTARALGSMGLESGRDLLRHLPRRYETWGDLTNLGDLALDEEATIQAQVVSAVARRTQRGRPPALLELVVTDGVGQMDAVLFGAVGHMQAVARSLPPGATVVLQGTVKLRRGRRQLTGVRLQALDELDDDERRALLERPMPVYPATASVASWRVGGAVASLLDRLTAADLPEPLPAEVVTVEGLIDPLTAYRWVHAPENAQQWRIGRTRLRHEEAFVLQAALARRRLEAQRSAAARSWPVPAAEGSLRADLDVALPFALTAGQVRVGEELADALASTVPMQRLLQGDVGSGKTVVALRAMLQVVGAGGQAALLAPTEVLAAQHASSLAALLGPLAGAGMLGGAGMLAGPGQDAQATRVHLLTGSTPTPRRRQVLADLASGEPVIVVGTHALLSESVQMPGLGLVVVDEQHRFGVAQRDALRARGGILDPATGERSTPHLLVMTATPIPRTIAMTVFGDLEISTLRERPSARRQVTTFLVDWDNRKWVDGVWRRAGEEVAGGGRVYVVCPRIDADSEEETGRDGPGGGTEGSGVEDGQGEGGLADADGSGGGGQERPLAAVDEWAQRLAAEPHLRGVAIGTLTGRMSGPEKDKAMAAFFSGATPVLVSTTVIEVGVDVPEATMMVILDAERFGLSQLHQLRGRVGRGAQSSICLAVTGAADESLAMRRLRAFASTTDGFILAEEDLELRREGDVLGAAQSGRASGLDLLQVTNPRHRAIIERARAQATAAVEADPELIGHPALAAAIAERLDATSQAYLDKA